MTGDAIHLGEAAAVRELLVRLRDAAHRMTAFSETKLLLCEAIGTIERLDRERSAVSRTG